MAVVVTLFLHYFFIFIFFAFYYLMLSKLLSGAEWFHSALITLNGVFEGPVCRCWGKPSESGESGGRAADPLVVCPEIL